MSKATSKVSALFDWSDSFSDLRPDDVFLDLIGYGIEMFGTRMTTLDQPLGAVLGYKELGLIGEALVEYSDNPTEVWEWISNRFDLYMN